MKQEWEYQRFLIRTIDSQPDEAISSYPVKSQLREYVATIKRLKCNAFADAESCGRCELPDPSLPVVTAPTPCALYPIDLQDTFLVINGWAVDALAGDAAGGVAVVIDGKPHPAYYGLRRDDVAKAFGNRKFNCSGFRCAVSAKSVGPGKHSLVIKVQIAGPHGSLRGFRSDRVQRQPSVDGEACQPQAVAVMYREERRCTMTFALWAGWATWVCRCRWLSPARA